MGVVAGVMVGFVPELEAKSVCKSGNTLGSNLSDVKPGVATKLLRYNTTEGLDRICWVCCGEMPGYRACKRLITIGSAKSCMTRGSKLGVAVSGVAPVVVGRGCAAPGCAVGPPEPAGD